MDTIKAKLAVWSKDKGLVKVAAIVFGVLIMAMIFLCISISMRANIHKKYSSIVANLQEEAYVHMTTMTELFSRIDDPNVDVRNKLIPELKGQYTAVRTINSVLLESGKKNSLLNQEQIDAFDAAFSQYITAFRQNSPTGLAKADMAECMEDVQEMVTLHNMPEVNPEDEIVIIDASSGKIHEDETQNAN